MDYEEYIIDKRATPGIGKNFHIWRNSCLETHQCNDLFMFMNGEYRTAGEADAVQHLTTRSLLASPASRRLHAFGGAGHTNMK